MSDRGYLGVYRVRDVRKSRLTSGVFFWGFVGSEFLKAHRASIREHCNEDRGDWGSYSLLRALIIGIRLWGTLYNKL